MLPNLFSSPTTVAQVQQPPYHAPGVNGAPSNASDLLMDLGWTSSNASADMTCETPTGVAPSFSAGQLSTTQQCFFGPGPIAGFDFQNGGVNGADFFATANSSAANRGFIANVFPQVGIPCDNQLLLVPQQQQLQQQLNTPMTTNQFQQQQQQQFQQQNQAQQQQQNLQPQAITITLQYGSQTETIVVERTQNPQILELFRQKARQMVERQIHAANSGASAGSNNGSTSGEVTVGELQLFLHDYKSPTMLQHLTTLVQLDNGSVVEIVRVDRNERPTRPHGLQVMSYITPTFCDYCGEILVGLIKQGLQCHLCKCNFHKKCALAPRNNCAKSAPLTPNTFLAPGAMTPDAGGQSADTPAAGTAAWTMGAIASGVANANSPQFQLPHTLSMHNYKTPTVCKVCDKMLLGFVKQGLRCRDCKVNVHKKCAAQLPMNCQITADNAITPAAFEHSASAASALGADAAISDCGAASSNTSASTSAPYLQYDNLTAAAAAAAPSGGQSAATALNSNEMIPLARLPGSAASRMARQGPTCEGWMIHFVLQPHQPQATSTTVAEHRRLRHYWILANGAINMYNEYNDGVNPNRVYKQIELAEIIALIPYTGPPIDANHPPHCFEIRTTANVIFCVGENLEAMGAASGSGAAGGGPPSKLPKHFGPYSVTSWQAWFQALQQSLQPPALRTDPENAEPALQFTQLYQICRDKLLGSGQFGTVYSGIHRQTGKDVAVKVIAKDRFSKKTNSGVETLKSEVAILQTIDHQGIIKLESMFETRDKIFVVMEKMNGDMLEMILSQASGRLNERCTKFLIMQILSALRYLHYRGIAHCDLKPENVLLSDFNTNFPQTKLCDFGYARFIDDTQFRKTIVGTPAYLAPEVLKKKGYNKSLDMWSVGVIIYVTLSGTFPFNDGEEISDQIHNASFMFPSDLWHSISHAAINLIQHLLRVKIEERMTIDECMAHQWLQDADVYGDMRNLERRLGVSRYLTSEQDDVRFGIQNSSISEL